MLCDLVINCTPVGMHPEVDDTPLHHSFLRRGLDRLRHDLHARADAADQGGGRDAAATSSPASNCFTARRPCSSSSSPASRPRSSCSASSFAVPCRPSPFVRKKSDDGEPTHPDRPARQRQDHGGRAPAARLGWACIDADEVLEQRAGMTIRDVFASEGLPGFRTREKKVLEELCCLERAVIATGGGAVLHPENRERISRSGGRRLAQRRCRHTLETNHRGRQFLETPTRAGGRRIRGSRANTREREPLYCACAHVIVDTAERMPAEVADAGDGATRGTPAGLFLIPCAKHRMRRVRRLPSFLAEVL